MKLWLDDVRQAPEDWFWAKSFEEALEILSVLPRDQFTHASLDHDLAFQGITELEMEALPQEIYVAQLVAADKNGNHLVLWMIENDVWPTTELSVHSANPAGAFRMVANINRYGPYTHKSGWTFSYGEPS